MTGIQPLLFEALDGHARTAVVVTDADVDAGLRILRATPAFGALLGVRADEVVGRPLVGFAAPETPQDEVERMAAEVRAGRGVLTEVAVRRSDGAVLWVEADMAPLRDDRGRCTAVVTVARDVTERRRTERELERAGRILTLAVEAGEVGVWEWDPETDDVRWNTALRRIAGLTEDEPADVGRFYGLVHPEDLHVAQAAAERRMRVEARYRLVRPDGSVRHVVARGGQGEGDAGPLVGTIVDITESQEAAARVTETLESITDAHYSLDHEWRFTYVNRHAEELLQTPREELLGRVIWDVFPGPAAAAFERAYRLAVAEQRATTVEAPYPPLGWFEARTYPVPTGLAVYFRNVDERRAATAERERLVAELHHQATHDALTGLTTREELTARLDTALEGGHSVAVLFLDVDRFKLVNDSLGHAVGDAMLRVFAERLRALTRGQDVVARIGGDEFVVGLVDTPRPVVTSVAHRVLEAARTPVEVDGHVLVPTASVGISAAHGAADAAALLRDADVALYRAKDAGRDQALWFDERARSDLLERVRIERDLRRALTDGELELHFQPAYDLRTGRRSGAEALLRWQPPGGGTVPPLAFIPVAEESGLIVAIGEWVLRAAARAAAGWGGELAGATVWANVSARQLARPGLADVIERVLEAEGVRPARLGIEVTESALGEHGTEVTELERVAALGVRIALDDFGTGHSSIARLRDLPVDLLKIDRRFIAALGEPGGVATVAAIADLGHALGKTVIAEGVETEAQLAALHGTGCDEVAGFLLARPVPEAAVTGAAAAGEELLRRVGARRRSAA